jgi:serine kinase of HPr protein (carbohydrate metabolism regulator)
MLERGWRLVADDYSLVWREGGALWAAAPSTIAGRIEARGLGVMPEPALRLARVILTIDCVVGLVERMPEPSSRTICGTELPRLALVALEPSAAAKLDRALRAQADGLEAGGLWPRTAPSPPPDRVGPARGSGTKGV